MSAKALNVDELAKQLDLARNDLESYVRMNIPEPMISYYNGKCVGLLVALGHSGSDAARMVEDWEKAVKGQMVEALNREWEQPPMFDLGDYEPAAPSHYTLETGVA